MTWLPTVMAILKEDLPSADIAVSRDYLPVLAEELERGRLDLVFMRAEPDRPGAGLPRRGK